MKVAVLSENTRSCEDFGCEHGLSLYIEANGRRLLFDTGQSELFESNAEKLGVDLSAVELAVLSHGHYDHGGGLKRFLQINSGAGVYVSRHAFGDHYNAAGKYIGLDKKLADCGRIIFTDGEYRLGEGLTLYTCGESDMKYPLDTGGLLIQRDGRMIAEDFRHEQYLLIEENGRRVLFSGCSHKGVLNLAERFRPDVFVGGFHYMKKPLDGGLRLCAERLDAYGAEYYTCHCTGAEQYEYMKKYMRRLRYISAGDIIEI